MGTESSAVVDESELGRAHDGDDAAFARIVAPLRRELHAHCYRMLGSAHGADDALQDALVRAWKGLARFEGRSSLRSWLYTVATRTCLDAVEGRGRRAMPMDLGPASEQPVVGDAPVTEVSWLGPYPTSPDDSVEQRESVELAFVAACQHLPGNQRAALLLFEVLGFSAAEIATTMDTTTASVNSALQRARRIVAEKVPAVSQQRTLREIDDARLRSVVDGYAAALERGDADALVALLTEDVTWAMPPMAHWYRGLDAASAFARAVPLSGSCGTWRHRAVEANGRPAVASWLDAEGSGVFTAWSIDVLRLDGDRIADITSFIGTEHFTAFGLPLSLPDESLPDESLPTPDWPGAQRVHAPMPTRKTADRSAWFPRTLGVATAAYSVAVIVRPDLFTGPTKLTEPGEEPTHGTAIGVRALGGRDLASGLAMAFAPAGTPLRTAVGVRVGSDVVDLVLLGTSLPDAGARKKAVGVAAAWGALCALSLRFAG